MDLNCTELMCLSVGLQQDCMYFNPLSLCRTGQPGSALEAGTYYVWTEVSTAMSGQIEECNELTFVASRPVDVSFDELQVF